MRAIEARYLSLFPSQYVPARENYRDGKRESLTLLLALFSSRCLSTMLAFSGLLSFDKHILHVNIDKTDQDRSALSRRTDDK